jgi:hypothetical protein
VKTAEARSHSRHHVRHRAMALVAHAGTPAPSRAPGAARRFGDTNVTMSDTGTWFDES